MDFLAALVLKFIIISMDGPKICFLAVYLHFYVRTQDMFFVSFCKCIPCCIIVLSCVRDNFQTLNFMDWTDNLFTHFIFVSSS